MPLVQLSIPPRNINIARYMAIPKRYQSLENWLLTARKVIPEIPNIERTDWYIWDSWVNVDTIVFELRDSIGNKAAVVIDRSRNQILG